MRGKSIRVALSHHKALIAVVVVMLLGSCMAIEETKPEDVEPRPRALTALVAAHNVTSVKTSLLSNMDTLDNEERVSYFVSLIMEKMGLTALLADAQKLYESQKKLQNDNYLETLEYRTKEKSFIEVFDNPFGEIVKVMRLKHGEAKWASIIYEGLRQEETVGSSYRLWIQLAHQWTDEKRSPRNVFLLLKINKVQDAEDLLDGPFLMWVTFLERAARFQKYGSRFEEYETRVANHLRDVSLLHEKTTAWGVGTILESTRHVIVGHRLRNEDTVFMDADAEAYRVVIGVLKAEFQGKHRFLEKALKPHTSDDKAVIKNLLFAALNEGK